ncbi:unnamed protein product [Phytomonas sp. Hart1]|nr:unnamed protein product [Phytomonas sp. Hart1]|eukprot:CCW69575.1 unnamed protein product [Phytomonas sp. isolate Hart1]
MDIPISVKTSNKEGVIELHRKGDKLEGSFTVALNLSVEPGRYILYRLRVKELSIVFSKTYGLLSRFVGGGAHVMPNLSSHRDSIYIYTDLSLSSSVHLSTIRLEYIEVSAAEAEGLLQSEVGRSTCRPFFSHGEESIYDVKCVVKHAVSTYSSEQKVICTLSVVAVLAVLTIFTVRKLSIRS